MTEDKEREAVQVLRRLEHRVKYIEEELGNYINMLTTPRRYLFYHFISGLARGLGIAIGATLLGAFFLATLFRLAELNVPLIGEFIARIVRIVQEHL